MANSVLRFRAFMTITAFAVSALLGAPGTASAVTITVDPPPDTALSYPTTLTTLPDEHLTFMPTTPSAATDRSYAVFGASAVTGEAGGAVLLQTTRRDKYLSFTIPPGGLATVMSAPVAFQSCNAAYDSAFDENYVGPGSVFQDPTRPAGNYIMIYEAENHCPGGHNQFAYYATIGFARSGDFGLTWPTPTNSRTGKKGRRPVLSIPNPEPTTAGPAMGDAIPSAFVNDTHIYVVYRDLAAPDANPPPVSPGILRIARARLIPEAGRRVHFRKWFNDGTKAGFDQEGLGGQDSPILINNGCGEGGYDAGADLSFNHYLGAYLLFFVCASPTQRLAGWYFSTATSLDLQDWAPPQPVANSQFPLTPDCNTQAQSGSSFDGWYPSLLSPERPTGHTDRTGFVYFLNGCNASLKRSFARRGFTIEK